jgi:hypothetical protein
MFLNIFSIVMLLGLAIVSIYWSVQIADEELIFKSPINLKDWGLVSLLFLAGILLGLLSFVMAKNDIYKPWAIKNSILQAISEKDLSYITNKVKDRDFLKVLSSVDEAHLKRIYNDKFSEALFEAESKVKHGYNEYALTIISKIGGPTEAGKLVDLLVASNYQRRDIIKALGEIGDSRAKFAMYAALAENRGNNSTINDRLLQKATEDTLEKLGDIRPSINNVCSVAIQGSTEGMYGDNKKMFKKGTTWRYMIEDNALLPPADTTINISSSINCVACVEAHYKKMFAYTTGFPSTTSFSGDAVKITWDIYIVDPNMKSITATTRLVGEDPPKTITVNKFNAPFGKHGYGIPPKNEYEQWVKELPTKQ